MDNFEKGKKPISLKQELVANTSGFLTDPLFTQFRKLTPILLFIAVILFFISYGAQYWAESTGKSTRREHLGLWRFCSVDERTGTEICDDFINHPYNDWLKAAQSFMTLAMFGFFATMPSFVAYVFAGRFNNKKILIAALTSSGATVLLLIIGMCSFAFRYDEYFWQRDEAVPHDASKLSWAFYLTLTSCLLTIIAQAFVALEILSDKYLAVDTEED